MHLTKYGKVPPGCWETAAIDHNANFKNISTLFGYGSLTFKPPQSSKIIKSYPAKIKGWIRRFWQKSIDHRGNPQNPGLVATIFNQNHSALKKCNIQDNQTWGVCYQIQNFQEMLPILDFRQKNGYTRTAVEVYNHKDQFVQRAVMYFAEEGNDPSFAGILAQKQIAQIVKVAEGPSGRNIDYLQKLHKFLNQIDIKDDHVQKIYQFLS